MKSVSRAACDNGNSFFGRVRSGTALVSIAVAVMSSTVAFSYGVIAADEQPAVEKAELVPINLAGRWSGNHYANTMRAPIRIGKPSPGEVAPKLNTLTYDIVACGDEWCGIAVTDAKTCGAVALKMKRDTATNRRNAFTGKLELAKGSAPYVIEAWYSAPDTKSGEGSAKAHLNFVGDTGGELLMMRRSFPFQAEMARMGEPTCTMEKATS